MRYLLPLFLLAGCGDTIITTIEADTCVTCVTEPGQCWVDETWVPCVRSFTVQCWAWTEHGVCVDNGATCQVTCEGSGG
jgi:hypothetical protein